MKVQLVSFSFSFCIWNVINIFGTCSFYIFNILIKIKIFTFIFVFIN